MSSVVKLLADFGDASAMGSTSARMRLLDAIRSHDRARKPKRAAETHDTALFGFQIYFDFSAYSRIAMGCALLMGLHFPENFDFPYLACSPGVV